MVIVGLTGGFGTGKTFTASVFRSLGAMVIDADRIAHAALKKGSGTHKKIIDLFGRGILNSKGAIDRRRLAGIVFKDKSALTRLNAVIHPYVIKRIKEDIRAAKDGCIVIDAPLLIEAGLTDLVDKVVVVKASRENQILRCLKRSGLGRKECLERIGSQMPLKKKIALADYVVDNDGTKSRTRRDVIKIWREIWR